MFTDLNKTSLLPLLVKEVIHIPIASLEIYSPCRCMSDRKKHIECEILKRSLLRLGENHNILFLARIPFVKNYTKHVYIVNKTIIIEQFVTQKNIITFFYIIDCFLTNISNLLMRI